MGGPAGHQEISDWTDACLLLEHTCLSVCGKNKSPACGGDKTPENADDVTSPK